MPELSILLSGRAAEPPPLVYHVCARSPSIDRCDLRMGRNSDRERLVSCL